MTPYVITLSVHNIIVLGIGLIIVGYLLYVSWRDLK